MLRRPPRSTLFPYTTLFRSVLKSLALPQRFFRPLALGDVQGHAAKQPTLGRTRSEEHTSELQSPYDLVCRLLLEKKKKKKPHIQNNKKSHKTTYKSTHITYS